jgi:hypothetical protein
MVVEWQWKERTMLKSRMLLINECDLEEFSCSPRALQQRVQFLGSLYLEIPSFFYLGSLHEVLAARRLAERDLD